MMVKTDFIIEKQCVEHENRDKTVFKDQRFGDLQN
jgi:hypothetical protein